MGTRRRLSSIKQTTHEEFDFNLPPDFNKNVEAVNSVAKYWSDFPQVQNTGKFINPEERDFSGYLKRKEREKRRPSTHSHQDSELFKKLDSEEQELNNGLIVRILSSEDIGRIKSFLESKPCSRESSAKMLYELISKKDEILKFPSSEVKEQVKEFMSEVEGQEYTPVHSATAQSPFEMIKYSDFVNYILHKESEIKEQTLSNIRVEMSSQVDSERHTSKITRCFFYEKLGQIGVVEENSNAILIYNPDILKKTSRITFEKNAITASFEIRVGNSMMIGALTNHRAISLCNTQNYSVEMEIILPDTHYMAAFYQSESILFTCGFSGYFWGWDLAELKNPEFRKKAKDAFRKKEGQSELYKAIQKKEFPIKNGGETISCLEVIASQKMLITGSGSDFKLRIYHLQQHYSLIKTLSTFPSRA